MIIIGIVGFVFIAFSILYLIAACKMAAQLFRMNAREHRRFMYDYILIKRFWWWVRH